jgi:hypothetical protein
MKFNVWFDLPEALVNISENIISKEDIEFSTVKNLLLYSLILSIESFYNFSKNENFQLLKDDNINNLQDRISSFRKEINEILFKSIKFSTKLKIKAT